jgi:hypothetical protein
VPRNRPAVTTASPRSIQSGMVQASAMNTFLGRF